MTAVCSVCGVVISALEPGASVLIGSPPGLGDQISLANLADQAMQHLMAYHRQERMDVEAWSIAAAHAESLPLFTSTDARFLPGVQTLKDRMVLRYQRSAPENGNSVNPAVVG